MSAQVFETVMAKLYSDKDFLEAFLENQEKALLGFDLTETEGKDFRNIDSQGLKMAAKSYAHKRNRREASK